MYLMCSDNMNFPIATRIWRKICCVYSWVNKLPRKISLAPYRSICRYILIVYIKSSQASFDKAMRAYSFFYYNTILNTTFKLVYNVNIITIFKIYSKGVSDLSKNSKLDNFFSLFTVCWRWFDCKSLLKLKLII